jgi:penicillin amidase
MLEAKEKVSIEDFKTMLLDTHSPLARKVAPHLARLKSENPSVQEAVKLFEGWDGNLSTESVAASIYEATVHTALSETLSDDLGLDLFVEYLGTGGSVVLRSFETLLDKPEDPLWDRSDTPTRESRDAILTRSLEGAVSAVGEALGGDMNGWTWGKLHTITPRHTFGSQPLVSGLFNLPSMPLGGDGTTVAVSAYDLLRPFEVATYQSYRMVVDLGDWSNSIAVYAGGQSGQPMSKYWGDKFGPWQRGEFNPLVYSRTQLEENKGDVLTLRP